MEQEPRTVWDALAPALDASRAFLADPDFVAAAQNPVFLVVSAVVIGVSFWRRWNKIFAFYVCGVALWGIWHFTIRAGVAGGIAYFMVGALIVAMAGISYAVFRR